MKISNCEINCTMKLEMPIAAAMLSEVHVNYDLLNNSVTISIPLDHDCMAAFLKCLCCS
jgi:hypothetical protein